MKPPIASLTPRRAFLKGVGAGALALLPFHRHMSAQITADPSKLPRRFVFVMRANGLRPYGIVPKGLEELGGDRFRSKELIDRDLTELELPESLRSLEPFKARLNIIQGLSSKVCKGPHGGHFGVLGSYTSGDHAPPRRETLDITLARRHPGVFRSLAFHIGIKPGELFRYLDISATGKNARTPAYASPELAYKETFGSVLEGPRAQLESQASQNLLDFLVDDVRRTQRVLAGPEREKLDHYLHGFESLRDRKQKLAQMGSSLRQHAPELDDRFRSEFETDRLAAHFDLAAAALVTGLTSVVTIRTDELDSRYQGFDHDRMKEISLHDIGHTADVEGMTDRFQSDWESGFEMRRRIRTFQIDLIAGLATKLAAVPEGDGTMLDNTVVVFLSDAGSQHHTGYENMPTLVLGNLDGAFRTGRYLHYPTYGEAGHRVLSNLWTSLLHASGDPVDRYGDRDTMLPETIDQDGPLAEFMS